MHRILVVPDRVEALGSEFGRASGELAALQGMLARAAGALDWEIRSRGDVENQVHQVRSQADRLAERAGELAAFLKGKAEAFRRADGVTNTPRYEAIMDRIREWNEGGGWPLEPAPADAFWDGLLRPPLVNDGNGLRFAPELQTWADKFNASVRRKWSGRSTDHAGTTGAESLTNTYLLTPEKVQLLWETATENHVDPRLLLAILRQEGTGSFNTNPVNSALYDGHGPQPDFAADLKAALDGPICSKLRLYSAAVKAGFKGSWVEWVNWYTPIDSAGFQGAPGVYAADINWGAGVAANYREIAVSLGGGSGDPVAEYSRWMGENGGLFEPKHVKGDFVLTQGIAPGGERPKLAVWGEYPQPNPSATKVGSWWWFPAPDEYCWFIKRK